MPTTLNCFYDLAVAPAYFDFITFLENAEMHRIRRQFDHIRIIFVPGPKQGFRNDQLRTTANNQLMMRNVLLPSCHLLPSCNSVIWLDQRHSAAGILNNPEAVFPRNYTLENPLNDYLESATQCAFLRDEMIAYLTAPADKQAMARAYINSVAGHKKILTVTLREAAHDASPRRQIDVPEWEKFFSTLDMNQYQPIIVRDTACTFAVDNVFANYPHSHVASIDVLFRMALYENAYINFFVNNGPYTFALYSQSNSVVFKYYDDSILATSRDFLKKNLAINKGDQRPITEKRTIICWDDDSEKNIRREFESMQHTIEHGNLNEQHNIGNTQQALATIDIAMRYTFQKMRLEVHEEDLKVLLRIQQYGDILNQSPNSEFNLKKILLDSEGVQIPKNTLQRIQQLEEQLQLGLVL